MKYVAIFKDEVGDNVRVHSLIASSKSDIKKLIKTKFKVTNNLKIFTEEDAIFIKKALNGEN